MGLSMDLVLPERALNLDWNSPLDPSHDHAYKTCILRLPSYPALSRAWTFLSLFLLIIENLHAAMGLTLILVRGSRFLRFLRGRNVSL